jgi:hypothetical protein
MVSGDAESVARVMAGPAIADMPANAIAKAALFLSLMIGLLQLAAEADSDISFEAMVRQTPMSCLDSLAVQGTLLLHSFGGWAAATARFSRVTA